MSIPRRHLQAVTEDGLRRHIFRLGYSKSPHGSEKGPPPPNHPVREVKAVGAVHAHFTLEERAVACPPASTAVGPEPPSQDTGASQTPALSCPWVSEPGPRERAGCSGARPGALHGAHGRSRRRRTPGRVETNSNECGFQLSRLSQKAQSELTWTRERLWWWGPAARELLPNAGKLVPGLRASCRGHRPVQWGTERNTSPLTRKAKEGDSRGWGHITCLLLQHVSWGGSGPCISLGWHSVAANQSSGNALLSVVGGPVENPWISSCAGGAPPWRMDLHSVGKRHHAHFSKPLDACFSLSHLLGIIRLHW